MRFRHLVAIALVLPASVWAAPPVVEFDDVHRTGDDLVMAWPAASAPVDGYRVYRSPDATCSPDSLVYEGLATSFTDPGVLLIDTPALYRVVSYVGAEESAPSEPAYKYPYKLGDTWDGYWIPWPSQHGIVEAKEMCTLLNGVPETQTNVTKVVRWAADLVAPITQSCAGRTNAWQFDTLLPHQAHLTKPSKAGNTVIPWGRGEAGWRTEFNAVRGIKAGCDSLNYFCTTNLYSFSLPYDHDYTDFQSIAADIPAAVEVLRYNRAPTGELDRFLGLTRSTSSDPWTGTNFPLGPRPSEGIFIAVDVPTTWYPRRLCTGPRFVGPSRIRDLRLSRAASETNMKWTPDSRAEGGYQFWRLTDKTAIPASLSLPVDFTVPTSTPVFPVVAPVAPGTGLIFYQAVGVDSNGEPGKL